MGWLALSILAAALGAATACDRDAARPDVAAPEPAANATPSPAERPQASASAPDVLLIVVDTLRADYLGTYGFPFDSSPRVDALAAEGVVFDRAIAASGATAPSHASIFTSKFTREHTIGYINGATRLQDAATLAEIFRDAGYATGGFLGNVILKKRLGFDRGFDVFDDDLPAAEVNRPAYFERIAADTSERALAWLASLGDRPAFLWVHYQDPHGPYDPPAGHADRIRIPIAEGEEPLPVLSDNEGLAGIPHYQVLEDLRLPSEYKSRYADEILYADAWIGTLIDAVDARAGERGAIVLFTADHGESFGEGYRWFLHGIVSTPDVAHVPLILRAPDLSPGRRGDTVSHVDVMPTLLELAGLELPQGVSGLALGPFLREGRPLPERLVYCDSGDELSAYRGRDFLRVKGVQAPWITASGTPMPDPEPAWLMYVWEQDGSWERAPGDRSWRPQIRRYYRDVVPMRNARSFDGDDLERLRALGYAAPAADAGQDAPSERP